MGSLFGLSLRLKLSNRFLLGYFGGLFCPDIFAQFFGFCAEIGTFNAQNMM